MSRAKAQERLDKMRANHGDSLDGLGFAGIALDEARTEALLEIAAAIDRLADAVRAGRA